MKDDINIVSWIESLFLYLDTQVYTHQIIIDVGIHINIAVPMLVVQAILAISHLKTSIRYIHHIQQFVLNKTSASHLLYFVILFITFWRFSKYTPYIAGTAPRGSDSHTTPSLSPSRR